jgi:hypothetical protein
MKTINKVFLQKRTNESKPRPPDIIYTEQKLWKNQELRVAVLD